MKIKKEYLKAIEYTLKSLNLYYLGIEEVEEKLKVLEEEYNDGVSGVNYTPELKSISKKINRLTENIAISNIEKREKLLKQLKFMKLKIEEIERQISLLDEKESEILTLAYIDKMKWEDVSYESNYSRAQCFRIRDSAIEKLVIMNYAGEKIYIDSI